MKILDSFGLNSEFIIFTNHYSLFSRERQILPQTENINYKSNDRLKKRLLIIVKIVTSISIIYFLINFIEFDKIRAAIGKADFLLILFAILLLPLNLFWQFKKWELVCNSMLKVDGKRKILFSLFYGISGGIITPLQAGEYVTRAIPFKHSSFLKIAIATAVDKLYPLLIVSFSGSIMAIPFLHYYFGISKTIAALGLIVILSLFLLLFLIIFKNGILKNKFVRKIENVKILKIFINELKEVKKLSKTFSIKMLVFSLLLILTFSFQYVLLTSAFTHNFELLNYLWFVLMVLFVKTILPPITFGEIGIREAASVYLGSYFGISQVAAFNAALILFLINLVLPSLFGLLLFMVKPE